MIERAVRAAFVGIPRERIVVETVAAADEAVNVDVGALEAGVEGRESIVVREITAEHVLSGRRVFALERDDLVVHRPDELTLRCAGCNIDLEADATDDL